MDLKVTLIAEWLEGNLSISEFARSYGVSRKTIYKWIQRYEIDGARGLVDRSRAPHRCPHALLEDVAEHIFVTKRVTAGGEPSRTQRS